MLCAVQEDESFYFRGAEFPSRPPTAQSESVCSTRPSTCQSERCTDARIALDHAILCRPVTPIENNVALLEMRAKLLTAIGNIDKQLFAEGQKQSRPPTGASKGPWK